MKYNFNELFEAAERDLEAIKTATKSVERDTLAIKQSKYDSVYASIYEMGKIAHKHLPRSEKHLVCIPLPSRTLYAKFYHTLDSNLKDVMELGLYDNSKAWMRRAIFYPSYKETVDKYVPNDWIDGWKKERKEIIDEMIENWSTLEPKIEESLKEQLTRCMEQKLKEAKEKLVKAVVENEKETK